SFPKRSRLKLGLHSRQHQHFSVSCCISLRCESTVSVQSFACTKRTRCNLNKLLAVLVLQVCNAGWRSCYVVSLEYNGIEKNWLKSRLTSRSLQREEYA